jgi:hypothetical protein
VLRVGPCDRCRQFQAPHGTRTTCRRPFNGGPRWCTALLLVTSAPRREVSVRLLEIDRFVPRSERRL